MYIFSREGKVSTTMHKMLYHIVQVAYYPQMHLRKVQGTLPYQPKLERRFASLFVSDLDFFLNLKVLFILFEISYPAPLIW